MSISDSDLLKIIQHFVPGDPLSYKLHDDGSLVVIADSGKKFTFTADQVSIVHNFLKTKPKTPPTTPKKAPVPTKATSKPNSTA